MPTLASEQNSIQMVPICGRGFGSVFVGRAVYLASMVSVGLKEVFIFLRLRSVVGGSVEWVPLDDVQSLWVGGGGGGTNSGAPLGSA